MPHSRSILSSWPWTSGLWLVYCLLSHIYQIWYLERHYYLLALGHWGDSLRPPGPQATERKAASGVLCNQPLDQPRRRSPVSGGWNTHDSSCPPSAVLPLKHIIDFQDNTFFTHVQFLLNEDGNVGFFSIPTLVVLYSFMRVSQVWPWAEMALRLRKKQSLLYSQAFTTGDTACHRRPHGKTPGWPGGRWQEWGEGLNHGLCQGFLRKGKTGQGL